MPRFTPLVESLPSTVPFVGPEAQERARGVPFRARLGANENGFGPSPRAVAAMAAAAAESWKYGDPETHQLTHALAAHHDVDPSNICVGEGIDGLLGNLVRLLVTTDTPVVTSVGAYPTFTYHVAGFGGHVEAVPFAADGEDPDALLRRSHEVDASLLYFSNPNNPMASCHPAATVQRLIDGVRPGAVLCLDEAYCDFAPMGTLPEVDVSEPRVVRMRTFSKAYGLAGIRVGYCIGHADLISAFDKVRNHFGVSLVSQAGALAALHDHAWLAGTVQKVRIPIVLSSKTCNNDLRNDTASNKLTVIVSRWPPRASVSVGSLGSTASNRCRRCVRS
jgi:histidinol-phosphate aminotransferase